MAPPFMLHLLNQTCFRKEPDFCSVRFFLTGGAAISPAVVRAFCERFGMVVTGFVEPKPGIPPTPSHTLELINAMKRDNVKLILVEPYFDLRTPNSIAQQVGGMVVQLMPSVGGVKEITSYFQLFDYDINLLVNAFSKVK